MSLTASANELRPASVSQELLLKDLVDLVGQLDGQLHVDVALWHWHGFWRKLTHVMYKANVNCSILREYLGFLTKQGLVKKEIIGKDRKVYAITQLGMTVLKEFRELKEGLPIVEETANKARNQGS